MSEQYINGLNSKPQEKPEEKELSAKERRKFKETFSDELRLLNALINDSLDNDPSDGLIEGSALATSNSSNKTELSPLDLKKDPLAVDPLADQKANALREKLNRIGLLNNDTTGKNKKAAGED